MMNVLRIYGLIMIAVILHTCVEPFYPDITEYHNLLVVDGMVTDENRPNMVRLMRTYSYEDFNYIPETGAAVFIIDDEGVTFDLEELNKGEYYTDTSLFRGEMGRSYQLMIVLDDGTEYQSDYVLLKRSPPVEKLYARYEKKQTRNPETYIDGIQIYLNAYDSLNESRFYRWEWEETWEFTVPMKYRDHPDRYTCWKSNHSGTIMLGNSSRLSTDRIIDYPLHFVTAQTNRLRILYSLQVKQYAISEAAYDFWNGHDDLGENAGTLFDPIPSAVPGNIYCLTDPEMPVLGFFEAAGVRTKRIFLNSELLPAQVYVPTDFGYCEFLVLEDPGDLHGLLSSGWIYIDEYYDMDRLMVRLTNSARCYDCTLTGSNKNPEYWPE